MKTINALGWRKHQFLLLAGLIFLLPIILPSGYFFRVASLIWMFGLAAVGLNVLMGQAGQVSLGHAGFIGIGSYAVALLPANFGMNAVLAAMIGALVSAILAYVVGVAVLKLKGHLLSIATLGVGTLIALVILTEARWTGGPDGMPVKALSVFGEQITSAKQWYWISGIILLVGVRLALNLEGSATGRAMHALRDSEVAAEVAGIDAGKYKVWAFVLAAIYGSVTGSMIALMNLFITPDQAGFLQSIELLMMVIIGGLGSAIGSVAGAAVIVLLPQVLTSLHDYEQLVLGLILMIVVGFFRKGIAGAIASLSLRLERK